MIWVEFVDEVAFHTYHDAACADHGIPYPGRNSETGEIMVDAQWTTAWISPIDDHGIIKANVPDADVSLYNLTSTAPPTFLDPETGLPVDDPPTQVTWAYTKEPGERLRESYLPKEVKNE
jgi:hypothetical protein